MTRIVLPALARGLLQERTLHLRPGPWALLLERPPGLQVDPSVLATQAPDVADLGCLAHECAHYWISRYMLFGPQDLPPVIWAAAMNAIEDPRANMFVQRRLPGAAGWIEAMRARDRALPLPTTLSRLRAFIAACSVADAWGFEPPDELFGGPLDVLLAYDETAEARFAYATTLPPHDLRLPLESGELERLLRSEAGLDPATLIKLGPSGADWEPHVTLVAARAYAIAERDILPVVRRLLEADLEDARERGRKSARGCGFGEPRAAIEDLLDAGRRLSETSSDGVHEGSSPLPPDEPVASPWHRTVGCERARRTFFDLLEAFLEGRAPTRAAMAAAITAAKTGEADAGPAADVADISALRRRMAAQVAPLLAALRGRLRPTRRLRSGFASGRRVDLRHLMQFEATGRRGDALWMRAVPGRHRRAAVHLLVDLSGSMASNSKIAAATAATVLFAETLARLGDEVEWAIDGFQDELVPVKDYAERPGPAVWRRIAEMPLEAAGRRPGGHNRPRWNDDGPCLREAGARLRARRVPSHLLLVMSDGRPEGRRSNENDLHRAVAELVRDPSLDLVGIGVGPGTGHVREFYPISLANVPLDELATRLSALLERRLAVR